MKRTLVIAFLLISACITYAEQVCDVILTTSNFQIPCIVTGISDSEVQYKEYPTYDNSPAQSISLAEIRKLYLSDGTLIDPTKGAVSADIKTKIAARPAPKMLPAPIVAKEVEAKPQPPTPQSEVLSEITPQVQAPTITKNEPKVSATQKESTKNTKQPKASVPQKAKEPVVETTSMKAPDIIITSNGKKIESKILEVTKSEVRYKDADNLDGPTFILNTEELNTIIYSNGKVSVFNQASSSQPQKKVPEPQQPQATPTPAQPTTPTADHEPALVKTDIDLARAERVNGIFVFNDCTPIASYDIIGEVILTGFENPEVRYSSGQYQTIRDGLIKIAKNANNQVEGVILTLVTGNADKAHLIKFKDSSEDHSLARAKRYSGIYIFCDCSPLSPYEYIGNINGKFTFIPQYTNLRDDFIKKCRQKYKNANGIILHLVTGGKDTSEAINL